MSPRRTKQTAPHTFPRDPVVTSPTSATKKGTASAWMLFFFAYEVQTPNRLRAAPAGRMGSPHQTNDFAHISARSGGYKSHLRNQKERDAHCVSLFFCFRSGFERLPAPGYPEVVDEQVKTLRWSVRSLTKPPRA